MLSYTYSLSLSLSGVYIYTGKQIVALQNQWLDKLEEEKRERIEGRRGIT